MHPAEMIGVLDGCVDEIGKVMAESFIGTELTIK